MFLTGVRNGEEAKYNLTMLGIQILLLFYIPFFSSAKFIKVIKVFFAENFYAARIFKSDTKNGKNFYTVSSFICPGSNERSVGELRAVWTPQVRFRRVWWEDRGVQRWAGWC